MSSIRILLVFIPGMLRNRTELAAENLTLRQQLAVLQQKSKRPRLRKRDRIFWVLLSQVSIRETPSRSKPGRWGRTTQVLRADKRTLIGWTAAITRHPAYRLRNSSSRIRYLGSTIQALGSEEMMSRTRLVHRPHRSSTGPSAVTAIPG